MKTSIYHHPCDELIMISLRVRVLKISSIVCQTCHLILLITKTREVSKFELKFYLELSNCNKNTEIIKIYHIIFRIYYRNFECDTED